MWDRQKSGDSEQIQNLTSRGLGFQEEQLSDPETPCPCLPPKHKTPALPRDRTTPLQPSICCKWKTLLQPANPSFSFQQGLVLGLRWSGTVLLLYASHWAKGFAYIIRFVIPAFL